MKEMQCYFLTVLRSEGLKRSSGGETEANIGFGCNLAGAKPFNSVCVRGLLPRAPSRPNTTAAKRHHRCCTAAAAPTPLKDVDGFDANRKRCNMQVVRLTK